MYRDDIIHYMDEEIYHLNKAVECQEEIAKRKRWIAEIEEVTA